MKTFKILAAAALLAAAVSCASIEKMAQMAENVKVTCDPGVLEAVNGSIDLSVVILGESGVGKENFARIIHQFSNRRNNSFFVVNCGALAKELVNSELFGPLNI